MARTHLRSLEGIRAYAFLLVFAVHFTGTNLNILSRWSWRAPWLLACQISYAAVPIFFALSGYLITGILVDTRSRESYFKTFYARRALRVLPLYYVTLAGLGVFLVHRNFHFLARHVLFLVYLQNFWPSCAIYNLGSSVYIGHLWSLAVEEQFYLIWPLIIWVLPQRRDLLVFCYAAIALVFVLRFFWPFFSLSSGAAYENTLFRSDALMMGAVLALHERGPMSNLSKLRRPAAILGSAGVLILATRALVYGQSLPYDYFGIAISTPVLSVIGASIVVLAITPGTLVHQVSEAGWAVSLGRMSYALYVLHQLFAPVFLHSVIPALCARWGSAIGHITGMSLAFALTYALAIVADRLIEQPTMKLKRHFTYGDAKTMAVPTREEAPSLGTTGLRASYRGLPV